jgi:hypothetical protein
MRFRPTVRRNHRNVTCIARLQRLFSFFSVRGCDQFYCNDIVVFRTFPRNKGGDQFADQLGAECEYLNLNVLSHLSVLLQEFVNNVISTMMYAAAFIIQMATWIGSNDRNSGANITAGFFGSVNTLLYAASAYYHYLQHKFNQSN